MNDWLNTLKIYSPGYEARYWGFNVGQFVDLTTALEQPVKIAVLPVFYNKPSEFSYRPEYASLDVSQFDLVVFVDIEFRFQTDLVNWIATTGVTNWLLSMGGLHAGEVLDARTVYVPVWSFNFLQWNTPRADFPLDRPFLFDCLCGTRRSHRDYVMLALERSGLLNQSIATYRDVFVGGDCTVTPAHVQAEFPGQTVLWPYVSPNLDPEWEVGTTIDHTISGIVPWEIYNRTYYSILVETLGYGSTYLMAEKIGKCLFGRRLFVHFGAANWLSTLKSFGFETFDSVLDESYDAQSKIDTRRYKAAFDQVEWLSKQNHPALLQKVRPILDHNHDNLYRFQKQKLKEMQERFIAYCPV